MTATQLQCQMCEAPFVPRTSGGEPQVFCSKKCTDRAYRVRAVERRANDRPTLCAECGTAFVQARTGRPRRFCSAKCTQRVSNRAQNRRRQPAPRQPERRCEHCPELFSPKRRDQVYCTPRCRINGGYARRTNGASPRQGIDFECRCVECGETFTARKSNAKWCSPICRIRTSRRDESRRRRPGLRSSLYADREIFERDGWICQLCMQPVDPKVPRRHRDGASIDHTIPLSLGGADEPSNVVTAHLRCNREKRDRVPVAALVESLVRSHPDLVEAALRTRGSGTSCP